MPKQIKIPDKLYFKIGEVSEIADIPTYVLRFWESEFPKIKPKRTPSGQRNYNRKDVELILKIKHLLYDRKYTIPGARQYLKAESAKKAAPTKSILAELRTELKRIRDLLD